MEVDLSSLLYRYLAVCGRLGELFKWKGEMYREKERESKREKKGVKEENKKNTSKAEATKVQVDLEELRITFLQANQLRWSFYLDVNRR